MSLWRRREGQLQVLDEAVEDWDAQGRRRKVLP